MAQPEPFLDLDIADVVSDAVSSFVFDRRHRHQPPGPVNRTTAATGATAGTHGARRSEDRCGADRGAQR